MTFSTNSGIHLFAVNYTLEGESQLASNSRSFQPLLLHLLLQETIMKTCQGDTVAPFNPLDCRCHWTSPSRWVPGDSHWSLCISWLVIMSQAYLCGPPAFTTTTMELLEQVLPHKTHNISSQFCVIVTFCWKYQMKYNFSLSRRGWSRTTFSTSASGLKAPKGPERTFQPFGPARKSPIEIDTMEHRWSTPVNKCQVPIWPDLVNDCTKIYFPVIFCLYVLKRFRYGNFWRCSPFVDIQTLDHSNMLLEWSNRMFCTLTAF